MSSVRPLTPENRSAGSSSTFWPLAPRTPTISRGASIMRAGPSFQATGACGAVWATRRSPRAFRRPRGRCAHHTGCPGGADHAWGDWGDQEVGCSSERRGPYETQQRRNGPVRPRSRACGLCGASCVGSCMVAGAQGVYAWRRPAAMLYRRPAVPWLAANE